MVQVFAVVLVLLAVPLVAAQAWVIRGMFLPDEPRRRAGAPASAWSPSSPTPAVSVVLPAHDE